MLEERKRNWKESLIREETSRLEEAVKELIHNETMGKELIHETNTDIQTNQTRLEKMMTLWTEAKEKLTENESNQHYKKR